MNMDNNQNYQGFNQQSFTNEQMMQQQQVMMQQQMMQQYVNNNQYPNMYQSYYNTSYPNNIKAYNKSLNGVAFNCINYRMFFATFFLLMTYFFDFAAFDGYEYDGWYKFGDLISTLSKMSYEFESDYKIYVWIFTHQNIILIPLIIASFLCAFNISVKVTDLAVVLSLFNLVAILIYSIPIFMEGSWYNKLGFSYYTLILGTILVIVFSKYNYRLNRKQTLTYNVKNGQLYWTCPICNVENIGHVCQSCGSDISLFKSDKYNY